MDTAEQIVTLLRETEVATAIGKATAAACRESGITEQTFYRWRTLREEIEDILGHASGTSM